MADDCETTFYAPQSTFGGPQKQLDPCNPNAERVPDVLHAPTGALRKTNEYLIPEPVRIWNHTRSATCAALYPGERVFSDTNSVVADGILTDRVFLNTFNISEDILHFIATSVDLEAFAKEFHGKLTETATEEPDADWIRRRLGVTDSAAERILRAMMSTQETLNDAAYTQAEAGLVCYWYNVEQIATCNEDKFVGEWAAVGEHIDAKPEAMTADMTIRSYISQDDADELAHAAAVESLNCFFINDAVKLDCREATGNLNNPNYEAVVTDVGPSHVPSRPPRKNEATVRKGAVTSTVSKSEANATARAQALALLSCYYINEPVDRACGLRSARDLHQDPAIVPAKEADYQAGTQGQFVTVPRGAFVSEVSTADATGMAETAASGLLRCCFINKPAKVKCEPYVVKWNDEFVTVMPDAVMSNRFEVEIEAGQFADCDNTDLRHTAESNQAVVDHIQQLAELTAKAALECAYCNIRINPTCAPVYIYKLISTGYVLEKDIVLAADTYLEGDEVPTPAGTVLPKGSTYRVALPLPEIVTRPDGEKDNTANWSDNYTAGVADGVYCTSDIKEWPSLQQMAKSVAVSQAEKKVIECERTNHELFVFCDTSTYDWEEVKLPAAAATCPTTDIRAYNKYCLHPRKAFTRAEGGGQHGAPTVPGGVCGFITDKACLCYHDPKCTGTPLPISLCGKKDDYYNTQTDGYDPVGAAVGCTNASAAAMFECVSVYNKAEYTAPESFPTPGTYIKVPAGVFAVKASQLGNTRFRILPDGRKSYDVPGNETLVQYNVDQIAAAFGKAQTDCFFVNHTAWTACWAEAGTMDCHQLASTGVWVISAQDIAYLHTPAGPNMPPNGSFLENYNKTYIARATFKSYTNFKDTYTKTILALWAAQECSFMNAETKYGECAEFSSYSGNPFYRAVSRGVVYSGSVSGKSVAAANKKAQMLANGMTTCGWTNLRAVYSCFASRADKAETEEIEKQLEGNGKPANGGRAAGAQNSLPTSGTVTDGSDPQDQKDGSQAWSDDRGKLVKPGSPGLFKGVVVEEGSLPPTYSSLGAATAAAAALAKSAHVCLGLNEYCNKELEYTYSCYQVEGHDAVLALASEAGGEPGDKEKMPDAGAGIQCQRIDIQNAKVTVPEGLVCGYSSYSAANVVAANLAKAMIACVPLVYSGDVMVFANEEQTITITNSDYSTRTLLVPHDTTTPNYDMHVAVNPEYGTVASVVVTVKKDACSGYSSQAAANAAAEALARSMVIESPAYSSGGNTHCNGVMTGTLTVSCGGTDDNKLVVPAAVSGEINWNWVGDTGTEATITYIRPRLVCGYSSMAEADRAAAILAKGMFGCINLGGYSSGSVDSGSSGGSGSSGSGGGSAFGGK